MQYYFVLGRGEDPIENLIKIWKKPQDLKLPGPHQMQGTYPVTSLGGDSDPIEVPPWSNLRQTSGRFHHLPIQVCTKTKYFEFDTFTGLRCLVEMSTSMSNF